MEDEPKKQKSDERSLVAVVLTVSAFIVGWGFGWLVFQSFLMGLIFALVFGAGMDIAQRKRSNKD